MMKLAESASLATPSLNRREPESPRSLTPKSLPSPRLINYHNTPQEVGVWVMNMIIFWNGNYCRGGTEE